MNEDNRKRVYDVLKSQTGYLDSYEDFNKAFDASEDNRKKVYDVLKEQTGYLDSYEDFTKGMVSSNIDSGEGSVARQVINEYDASVARENENRTPDNTSRQISEETKRQIIANKPDMFKRDTRSLLDKGAGIRVGVAQPPSGQENWQELFNRLNADISQRADYVYGRNGTYIAKKNTSNQLDSILSDVDTMEQGLREKAESRRGAHNGYAYATPEEARENNLLRSARSLLEDAKSIVEETGKKEHTNFISGLFRGMRDNLSIDDITFGIADAVNEGNLNKALQKYDRGEQLTEAEEKLLEASAVNLAVQNYFGSDLGAGYKAGQVTAASLPFMLEFAVNPVARSGNAIAKGLLKFGMNRFGRAGSFASRVAGSTGAALGMTATTGLPQVASNTMERLNENYEYYLDGNGDLQFGKTGNVNNGEALGKSIVSTALTNQSEMVLNAFRVFRPYLRRMNELMPGSVDAFMKSVKNSRPGQLYREIKNNPTIRELAQRTQFQGFPQEYLEEVYNNLASVPLGDMTMEDVVDLQNNIDIALGLAPTMVAFSMIGTGGMAAERYRNRRRMERIFGKMSPEQRKKFEELQRLSRQNGNEDIKVFIRETATDPSLTQEQKREEIEYAFALATDNAINEVQEAETEDRIEREARDILANSDQEAGTYTECVRYVTNDVGERVEVPGYIVGHMGGRPLWKPEGADETVEAIPLKDGEYDPASIKSMPVQEVIDETAQAIREDAEEQARRESTYSTEIMPPAIGTTFTDGTAQYQIVQTNPDGGWLATKTTVDDKGKEVKEVVPVTDADYYNMVQVQIDAQEASMQSVNEGNNGTENIPQNGNIEPQNIPASTETLQAGTTGQSALERIPKDEQGKPIYEQADPETAWDAIVEQTGGDEGITGEVIADLVEEQDKALKDAEKELKKVQEGKPQQKKGDAPLTMDERIAAKKAAKEQLSQAQANVEEAKKQLAIWKDIANTPARRKQAALAEQSKAAEEAARLRRAEEEKLRAEREEAERIRREALNGVPDFVEDTPQDARARGYRRVNGNKVDRQQAIPTRQGNEVQVKFDDNNIPTGHVSLIDASQLQPSHINGQRNPLHFIDEAQPKERNDEASVMSARKIAANIRPEEITSSVTAYTGAPTVNTRGEVIQGNNRSAALREMWAEHPEQATKYKQYLTEHAADFGLAPEDVEAMQQPVLVNMLDVTDDDAITLGQFVAQDTESGGTERIKPKNIVQKMGGDMRSFAGRLLASPDEEMSFAELIDRNGLGVLKWMQQKGYITPTQYKSAFDSKDNLTAEAKNDLKGVMYQSIFQNGNTHLEEMFNALPSKAQKAILATAYRDYDSPNAERMNAEIQNSISAYYALSQDPAFANARNYKEARIAAESWKRQLAFDDVTGESYLPSERYSNFALLLATMYKGQTQTFIQNTFTHIFDLVQGTQETTLFDEPDNTPRTLVEAINETLGNLREELLLNGNFTYNGQQRSNVLAGNSTAGQQRQQGSDGGAPAGERVEDGDGTADRSRGTGSGSTEEEIERREAELASRVKVNDDDWQEGDYDKPTYKRSILIDGKHTATQVDQPDKYGHYTGSYFEFDNKRFGDIAEIVDYIDNGHTLASKIAQAEAETDTAPTEAQKEAGNYKKGHVRIGQFDITVENPKGSVRRGVDASGKAWEQTMRNTYGYIRGTEGVDGDHIDVFLTNDIDGWNGRRVYIVDQYNEDGTFDEHKVMLGFNDEAEAQDAYLSNYEKGWEYKHKFVMSSVNLPDFEKWINSSHRKTKPFAEYKSVKVEGTQSEESNALQNQKQKRYRLLQSFVSTKDGKLKKKYADTFKNPVYAVFDSNNPNSEPFYIASSPRDALNAAFNYDIENFDVLYVNATEKKIELGAYSLLAYGQDASYDSDGAFREKIKQRLAEDIGKLGPTRLKESNIKNGNDHFPGSGKMNREQEEAEKSESRSAVSQEMDENGHPFILASDGTSTFGNITEETGLAAAPIKLSEGFQSEDGKGYGLAHIEYRHGEQIRNAGFPSVEKFVEDVAKNFTVIKRGNARGESETYLLEVQDAHNNTLFVELSKDGSYWNVNSAGVFKKGYSKKKDIVWTVPALGSSTNADATEVHHGQSKGETVTSGNSSQTISSEDKGSDSSDNSQTSSGFIARTLDDFKADRESVVQSTVEDLKDEYATANLSKTDEEIRKEAEELVDYNEEADLYMEVWDRLENLAGSEYMDKLETDARKNGEDRLSLATMIEEIERRENRVQEEAEKIQQQSGPVEKIEDVGEKIGGAKKDRFKEFAEKEKQLQEQPDSFIEELRKLPVSKIFNFNLEALRKDGLSNEAATLIDVIRRVIPSKPRTDWKLKRWVSDVFGLYRFCLTLATAEQGTLDQILRKATFIRNIGGMYRAQMALGGFDSGLDTGQATLEELGDSAGHYDKDDNWVSIKGQWYVTHAGRYGGIYPDYEKAKEALTQFAGENSKRKEKGTEVKFSIYSYKHSGEAFITPKGKPGIVVESGFKSRKEALDYLNEHMDELQAKYRNMKDATSIGFAPNGERRGKDWRGGKDVTAEDFRNTFGFRGVEFGNWANQQERQLALNQAYDAFMDLSEATGISPQGLSLGGELGMAFGARGGGGAAAHYEPGKVVINLTKTQGAGTLAHEWWHAIDNYFSRRRGQALGYNTERKGYNLPVRGGKVEREHEAERKEITDAFAALMKAINGSSYGERSNAYASLKSSYWKEPTELGARAFAVWVERKLSEKGIVNNFLANNNTIGWESPELTQKYYPYPLESDFESLDTAFDGLFGAIEEKVDEETGNTILYRFIGEQGASRLDAAEEATTRMDNLAIARKMEEEGKNEWAIKWATGWERGADRKWRYETPDFEYTPPEDFEEGKNYNLSDIIKDDELFTAYPKLRGLKFRLANLPDEFGGGWFDKRGNEIVINTAHNSSWHYESTIAHEIQHAIQAEEGFEKGDHPDAVIDRYLNAQYEIDTADIHTLDIAALIRKRAERLIKKGKYKYMRWAIRSAMRPLRGRNDMYSEYGPIETLAVYHTAKDLKDAYEKAYKNGKSFFARIPTQSEAESAYMRNAGETEARNVARRLRMTPEQRRNMLASETEDVARRDQLFINSALSEQASYAPAAEDMSMVNERFNKELQRYQDGQMSKNDMFHLGNPYGTMRMFLPDLPIVMRLRIMNKASNTKHNVEALSLTNLPQMISSPIFVFKRGDNALGVLTEIKDRDGLNVCVAIELGKRIQDGGDFLEVNDIRSIHGRDAANLILPIIHNNTLAYVDKEKGLTYLSSASSNYQQEIDKQDLSDATKIVENFENPIIEEEILRSGEGFLSDDALSVANDPMSKFLGKSPRTARQRRAFTERERRNMANRVQELAEKLHLDNVEIVNEPMVVTDKKGKTHYPKGFYNRTTDKITIVIPNNVNTFDAEQTLLHEAVAHYGLRRLFEEHFDTFLDNVFNNADVEVRRKIVALAQKNGWDTRLATEEYLASLAEDTNFDDLNASWWRKIKDLFLRMLHKIGFEGFDGVTLSDNELRYILWRSYESLREPGRYRSILGQAEDIAKQYELKVGNYAPTISNIGQVAESKDAAKAERIRKLRESKPVEITGNEIEPSDDLKQYKKNALEYGKKLRGEYTNKDTGETISLTGGNSRGGIREILQHDYKDVEHLQSIAAIPQIIENSIFIDELPNEDFDKYPGVSSFSYYVCGLKIGKEDYTVKAVIANQSNGERYYDHKLTHIEKGKLLSIVPTIQKAGMEGNSPLFGIKDKRLLSILQDNADENLLFRKTPDGNTTDDGTREAYNRAVSGNRFKAQEAYQDSMLALKRLQEVIEQKTGKLKGYENAYLAENQMSSKSTREAEVYGEKYFKPMLEAVGSLIEQGASYGEIIDYMIAKHGLERNEVFAERDTRQEADHRFEKLYKEIEQLYKLRGITEEEYNERKGKIDAEKEKYYRKRLDQHLGEDYSGLTALAEKYDAMEEGFKKHAQELVRDFEQKHDTRDLWAKVNAATKETLRKSYESGMMSRDTYLKVKEQFKHYIPLRGWDEQTAEDVYEYINSETSPVNSVLKAAKGRRSMADDPLATIGNMAESTILQGNRNLMKQAFLNMAINHPTDVLTLKEAWYVQDPSTGEWTLSFPDIQEGDDADTVSAKVEEHEQRMRELKTDGLATQVKEGLNINYRIGTHQAQEHIVTVKRNGKDYLVYVNGNPRAAQAVNGLTNPTVESNKLLAGIARFNRELVANFTNRNPAFVLSNLSRDLIFSVSAVAIKENPRYAARFAKNIPRAMRVIFRNLRGKGSRANADDRLFEEFLANGGETGYTSLHSVDEYKKLVKRSVDKYAGKRDYFAAVRSAAGFFSMMNRWAEDVSRFTTYMTSKEEGRTITEAVNDAKEVTVNFNRRGAATKTEGVFGWTSGLFRNLYLFFNAAVQSLTNFARLAKKNRKGFLTALGGFTAAGFLVPWLNTLAISMLGGDDDDYYGNLPDWVRRNNLCLYAGNGKFITIPLPIELRAFYGLGEMAYQATVRQDYDKDQIAYQAVNQITELLPINPLGNNGDLVTTMMPDVLSPFWQIYENKDFTGKPIYRENAFNKTMPEWTKAYNSTSDWLVDLSRWTNALAGGDDYKQAGVLEPLMNWNPAKVEHLFESYFGGMAKTINQTAKTLAAGVESVQDGEKSDNLQWYSTPVLNRFVNDAGDDRSAYSKLNQRYYKLYDLYEEVQKLNRGYANEVARGNMDYLDKLVRLQQSRDFKVFQLFRSSKRAIDRIRDIEKRLPEEGSEQRSKELQEETSKIKRMLLERVDELVE